MRCGHAIVVRAGRVGTRVRVGRVWGGCGECGLLTDERGELYKEVIGGSIKVGLGYVGNNG